MPKIIWAIDTNILVYLLNANSSQHTLAQNIIQKAKKENISIVITQQNIIELVQTLTKYYSVPLKEASEKSKQIIKSVNQVLHPHTTTLTTYLKLCKQNHKPKSHFDLYLASTLLSNQANIFITNNPKDFTNIMDLKTIPLSNF
jgi:predicted nucleic acid-binding protein